MSEQKKTGHSWSGIRAVISDSLKQVEIDPKDSLEWVSLCWGLIVGREISKVSQVTRVAPKTLHVEVAGKEWVPALESLKEKIIEEMRQQPRCGNLTRIVFQVKRTPASREKPLYDSALDKPVSNSRTQKKQRQPKRWKRKNGTEKPTSNEKSPGPFWN